MTAPIASGWSGCRVGFAPTGKRRLCSAHATLGNSGAGEGARTPDPDLGKVVVSISSCCLTLSVVSEMAYLQAFKYAPVIPCVLEFSNLWTPGGPHKMQGTMTNGIKLTKRTVGAPH